MLSQIREHRRYRYQWWSSQRHQPARRWLRTVNSKEGRRYTQQKPQFSTYSYNFRHIHLPTLNRFSPRYQLHLSRKYYKTKISSPEKLNYNQSNTEKFSLYRFSRFISHHSKANRQIPITKTILLFTFQLLSDTVKVAVLADVVQSFGVKAMMSTELYPYFYCLLLTKIHKNTIYRISPSWFWQPVPFLQNFISLIFSIRFQFSYLGPQDLQHKKKKIY